MKHNIQCPFCGKDITNVINIDYIIPQEETVSRDYSTGQTWAGGYLKETKYVRKFEVHCCEQCFKDYKKNEKLTLKMAQIATPIGFIAGIIYTLYWRANENLSFSIGGFFQCLMWGVLGVLIFGIPTGIVNLATRKKISYKDAEKYNAIYTGPFRFKN